MFQNQLGRETARRAGLPASRTTHGGTVDADLTRVLAVFRGLHARALRRDRLPVIPVLAARGRVPRPAGARPGHVPGLVPGRRGTSGPVRRRAQHAAAARGAQGARALDPVGPLWLRLLRGDVPEPADGDRGVAAGAARGLAFARTCRAGGGGGVPGDLGGLNLQPLADGPRLPDGLDPLVGVGEGSRAAASEIRAAWRLPLPEAPD